MPTAENPLCFVHISDTHINPDTSYIKDYVFKTAKVYISILNKFGLRIFNFRIIIIECQHAVNSILTNCI